MDVKLPKLGEGAESGVVVSLAVKEGDQITKGQTILELENEKAVAAIPSSAAGTVRKINVKMGDRISAGQVILVLDAANGGPPEAEAPKAAPKPAPKAPRAAKASPAEEEEPAEAYEESEEPTETAADRAGFAPPASPSLRKLAREIGLDLRKVRGTDAGGRISVADVRGYIQRLQREAARPKPAPAAPPAVAQPKPESIDFSQWGPVTKKPLPPIRLTISRRMVENKASIPHVTQFDEADITIMTELRKKYAAEYEKEGARLTLTSFALKAVANALQKFPSFNCSLDEATNELVFKNYYHIGLAVDTEQGLLVPVIRDVNKKDLLQLSKEVQEFAEKARNRKVALEEMKGGTFTISNQGGIGGAHFTPIINKPEVAILGLGRGVLKPVVRENNKIEPRLMMPMGLSYDHRVIDGGEAARFTVELVQVFEKFREEDVRI
jgi:pyruvate dehydrogenase E2 component (dihydrolipoamide acetyltransferase)